VRLAAAPPGVSAEAGSKPARTFAASAETAPPAEGPLHKTAGEVQLAFTPPSERVVGAPVVGELAIAGSAEGNITVTVASRRGLRVTNAKGGVLYEGPLRRGETLQLPVQMIAVVPGTQRLRLHLAADVPLAPADLDVVVPGFEGEYVSVKDRPVMIVFRNTPLVKAIREMANAVGGRVVIHEEVEDQRVDEDFSAGVPFEAALRILCEHCGYRVVEEDGVYHVLK
jgi:hypothetical protein